MSTSAYGKAVRKVARLQDEVERQREAGEPLDEAKRQRDAAIAEAVRELHVDGYKLLKDAMGR